MIKPIFTAALPVTENFFIQKNRIENNVSPKSKRVCIVQALTATNWKASMYAPTL